MRLGRLLQFSIYFVHVNNLLILLRGLHLLIVFDNRVLNILRVIRKTFPTNLQMIVIWGENTIPRVIGKLQVTSNDGVLRLPPVEMACGTVTFRYANRVLEVVVLA